jgi:hypothetical protein
MRLGIMLADPEAVGLRPEILFRKKMVKNKNKNEEKER